VKQYISQAICLRSAAAIWESFYLHWCCLAFASCSGSTFGICDLCHCQSVYAAYADSFNKSTEC